MSWLAPHGNHVEMARSGDAPVLARIHAEGFFRGWAASDFEAYLADRDIRCYVVADAKRHLGGFALARLVADEAEILTIAVEKRRRGKGLGKALLAAILADLTFSPVRKLFLEVDEANAAARAVYARQGFLETGTRRDYYMTPDGQRASALVMRLDLD
jgi:ribosomal-protein-alanine N-acetyltransferase